MEKLPRSSRSWTRFINCSNLLGLLFRDASFACDCLEHTQNHRYSTERVEFTVLLRHGTASADFKCSVRYRQV